MPYVCTCGADKDICVDCLKKFVEDTDTRDNEIRYYLVKLSESYALNVRSRVCDTDIPFYVAQLNSLINRT